MPTSLFFLRFILFFKVSLDYRSLAGTSCWIKVLLNIKTSCFIEIQKNKLNSKSGKPCVTRAHSPLHMHLSCSVNNNA